jgi:hypothetical protein
MEKEITSFDFFAMVVDLVYKILMFVLCIGTAFYVVHSKGFVLLVVLSILAILLKTFAGLFNVSLLVDILQYYMDLGISLFVGYFIGLAFQAYITGFYHFSPASLIVAVVISLILAVLRGKTVNKRKYYDLLR